LEQKSLRENQKIAILVKIMERHTISRKLEIKERIMIFLQDINTNNLLCKQGNPHTCIQGSSKTCIQGSSYSCIQGSSYSCIQGSSETIRDKSSHHLTFIRFSKSFHTQHQASLLVNSKLIDSFDSKNCSGNEKRSIFEWLTGLIEADGGFYVSKKGYPSCEITMASKEIQSLYKVKKLCGGKVQIRTQSNAVRWRLHSTKLIRVLLPLLADHFHTEKTFLQFLNVWKASQCSKNQSSNEIGLDRSRILHQRNQKISRKSAWFAGFFCGDGSLYINPRNFQITLSLSQKTRPILELIQETFGGHVYKDIAWDGYVWQISDRKGSSKPCNLQGSSKPCNLQGLQEVLDYFDIFSLQNPRKEAQRQSVLRFLRYKDRGDHLNENHHVRLRHFIKVMND